MKLVLAALGALALSAPAFAQAPHDMSSMPGMAMAAPAGVQGAGVVKKIDAKAGSVTLQHGPIAALNWPAMTMAFKADPALLKTVKVGQQVAFTVKTGGAAPEAVAIQPK
ncbi:MAG: copper-binding protein [Phenylobacterium sp.]|uniref:copper-binding protein n=1 Tax=Phenylobacterium sp. TaxID=1871053 RepID=UPI001A4712D7|nr:copper-binding protein [Phenylobacterium sp.]MBL8552876.1 copper-binding protein [Phenylobacterium sp.]